MKRYTCASMAIAVVVVVGMMGGRAEAQVPTWTPSNLVSGVALWLDASDTNTVQLNGSSVTNWLDKSGNGRNALGVSGAYPILTTNAINGFPAITNNGSMRMTSTLSGSSASETIIAVLKVTSGQTILGSSANGGRQFRLESDYQLGFIKQYIVGLAFSGAGKTIPLNTALVAGFTYDSSTTTFYTNGATCGNPTSVNPGLSAGLTTTIGYNGSGNSEFFNGLMGEIVVCSSVLSTADRQKIEGYLAWKWGLQANLPSDHPFKLGPPSARGGVVTYTDSNGLNPTNTPYANGYVVHTFYGSDTFSNSTATSADVLVVAGGGAGGNHAGGGGGAGGLIYYGSETPPGGHREGTSYSLASGSNYTITVGAGGINTGTGAAVGTKGGDAKFGSLTAFGGGYGGSRDAPGPSTGGSGGGGCGGAGSTGAASSDASQGFGGGNGINSANYYPGGGGGGAGGAGAPGTNTASGAPAAGGPGLSYSISGTPTTYARGGAGEYNWSPGSPQANAAANTGNGGNGVQAANPMVGADGGSGIVIVRYQFSTSLSVSVTAPTAGQVFLAGSSVTATVAVANGSTNYQTVSFHVNGAEAWSTNNTATNLFTIPLGALGIGTYTNYAYVQDATNGTAYSATNTFTVVTPPSSFFWTNAASGPWGTAGNWTNEAGIIMAPVAAGQTNYTLNFNGSGAFTASNSLNPGFLLNQLNFGGASATLAGASMTLTNSGATLPQVNQNSAAAVTVNNDLVLGTNVTFGGSGTGTVTVAGAMSGAGGLTKTNSGTLMIGSTNNNYGGATVISGGTVKLGGGGGSTPITIQNPGFTNPGIADFVYYSGMNAGQKSSIVWVGDADYVYSTTGGGTWGVPANSGPAVGLQNQCGIKQTINLSAGNYTLMWKANGRSGTQVNPYYVTVDGGQVGSTRSWNNSGSTWKADTQALTIATSGNHDIGFKGTSAGDSTVFLDDITLTSDLNPLASLASNTALSLGASGTLDLCSVNQTIASLSDSGGNGGVVTNSAASATLTINPSSGSPTFSGAIRGPISVVKSGIATQVLAGVSMYTGGTTVSNGALLVNGSITGTVTVASGATLGGTGAITGNVTFNTGAFAFFTNDAAMTFSGTVTLNSNVVHLALPDNLADDTYLLATNTSGLFSGSFAATPVIDSGSTVGTNRTVTTEANAVRLIVSSAPIIVLSPSSLPDGTRGIGYSQTLTASGGTGPYTYTNVTGSLPSGLTLTSGGLLSGTPDTAGTNDFTVQATDALAYTGTRDYRLVIPPTVPNTATNSGFWTNAATWSAGVPQLTHDVIIPAGITVTNTGLTTNYINSLSITGTLTHAANTSTEANKLNLSIAGDLTVASNGAINVNGKGYGWNGTTAGYGPGGARARSGAAHGGQGGHYDGTVSLVTYGSVTNPVNLGSGCAGRSSGAQGSAGGGAIVLYVGGAVTNNGLITADGDSVSDQSSGSGGSVNITAASFAGTNTISAIGGTSNSGRAGAGGGRIALIANTGTTAQFNTVTINARGGDGGPDGGAGTIYLKAPTQTYGSLVIKNVGAYTPALTIWTNQSPHFDSIITTNYGVLAVGTNSVLDFTGTTLASDSTTASITSRIILYAAYTSRYLFPASFTNAGCLSQSGTNLFPFPGDVIVTSNGVFTHEDGLFATASEANRLNLSVAGNLTVNLGGAISVKGRGYGAAGGTGYGPGGGPDRSGASHGGQGADGSGYRPANTVTYGSIINPVNYGSGGGGRDGGAWPSMGGGAIVLQVGGTVTVNGLITADGNEVSDQSAAAGGSVNISAASFAGTNTISAKGGRGLSNGGGAGGGRIALKASGGDSTQFNTLIITAAGGGTGNGGLQDPGAGTVYLEAGSQGVGKGTVWINNGGAPSPTYTYTSILPFTNSVPGELSQALVAVTNYGKVFAPTNATIGNLLIYTNSSWTLTNWTLRVKSFEHSLESLAVSGPGYTNRVDKYAQVIWNPPDGITNTAATNVRATTADLVGTLSGAETNYDVTVYWSVNNNIGSAAWLSDGAASNAVVGTFTGAIWQPVTGSVASLTRGATYYYTLVASNGTTTMWASPNASFTSDGTPPTPDPMGFAVLPSSLDETTAVMTASNATDALNNPVEYFFTNTVNGDTSGWIPGTVWTNTGLASQTYGYQVKARDAVSNETAWSPVANVGVGVDETPPNPSPMNFVAFPAAVDAYTIAMRATTATDVHGPVEYFFTNTVNGSIRDWSTDTAWTNGGLTHKATYGYQVRARDSFTNVTAWSAVATAVAEVLNTATNSGNWEVAGTWSRGVPQSTHDVFIPAGITVTNNGLGPYSVYSLSITGLLTHAANTSTEANKLNLSIAGGLTVASNGAINVNGKGYGWNGTTTGYGPGGSVGRGGAAHGGQGGQYDGAVSLVTYGSVTNPVNLGSGCAARSTTGSAGGGAIVLYVGGAVTNNGLITADGDSVSDQSSGSGGSVNITAASFAGTNTISAIGGTSNSGRAGAGGGRIALIANTGTTAQFNTLTINARGGDGGANSDGGAGTIYLKVPTQPYGSLVIKNVGAYTPALTTWTNETWRFDSITTTNYGTLAVGTNSVLDFTGTTLVSDSTTNSITSRIILYSTYTNRYVFPAPFTNGGCLSQSGTNVFPFPGDVIVSTNGVLTHEGGLNTTTTEANRLNLNIAGNLTVQAGGAISVKGRGYGCGATGYGPGGSPGRAGASHGGQGANSDSTASTVTYGSVINPVNYGSGGGNSGNGIGGGAVLLRVGGAVTVVGLIMADGSEVADNSVGAGGSVNILATSFAGTGTISAKGGKGLSNAGGAGGGRIALKASGGDATQFSTLTITAAGGGSGNGGYLDPGAGTVYLEAGPLSAGKGTVWINNGGAPTPTYTYTAILPFTNSVPGELSQALVAVTNYGKVLSTTNISVGNLLIYTNSSWTLTNWTLYVDTEEHNLENLASEDPGTQTNRVDHYNQVIWLRLPAGTLFKFR